MICVAARRRDGEKEGGREGARRREGMGENGRKKKIESNKYEIIKGECEMG